MNPTRSALSALVLASALLPAWATAQSPAPEVSTSSPASAPASSSSAAAALPEEFRNPDLPVAERVDDLIARLTLEEKVSQIGMENAAIPRLGIPSYHWWNEGLHGVARNGVATVFPQAIGLAATWNPTLHQQIADVISTEARAKFHETVRQSGGDTKIYEGLTIWSPNINIFRDPRWGRGQETYGEDPLLSGVLGVAFTRGLQGDDPRYLKTVATLKHFAVHSGPETPRHHFDAVISPRDLREIELPPFEMGIREGHATSVMSAYNAINGIPAPGNRELLTDILRAEWGFDGAVVGDVGTVSDMHNERGHKYVKTGAEAIAAAIKAGNELCSDSTFKHIPEAIKRGLLTEADVDNALRRLYTLRFRLGLFDPAESVPYARIPISANDTPAHDRLALEAARQSLVLLKNDGTLPWDAKKLKHVAILGPTGDDYLALLGNYAGTPARPVTLAQALRARLEAAGVKVTYDPTVPLVAGFREGGRPFAEGILFSDEKRSASGLTRELFAKNDFTTTPADKRSDTQIDFYWNPAQPVPGLPVENVNLRWSGVLVPTKSGEHDLGISYIGAAQLFIDDKPVAGDPVHGRSIHNAAVERVATIKLPLEAGRAYRVRLEYTQRPGTQIGRIQFGWRPPGGLNDALAQARAADHIVLTLGITPALEGEEMKVNVEGFAGGDRTSILLPKVQRDLIDSVAALGKPFIVVLCNGSPLAFDTAKPNAILEAWYYGQRGGDAVADAILGDYNPAGRLPLTFYRDDRDLPPFEDYSFANRTYLHFKGKPLYAFGHGLSYTTFSYEKFTLSASTARTTDTITASVTIKNSGPRDGDEVIQLYATAQNPLVPMPLRQLVGFQRVPLKAGETKTVDIALPIQRLRRWDESRNDYVVDPITWTLAASSASDNPLLKTELRIAK